MKNPPILIVTCIRDVFQLKIMIKSFEEFLDGMHEIYIIGNEKTRRKEWEETMATNLIPIMKSHEYHVIHCDDIFKLQTEKTISIYDGWLDQQILKLAAAKYINAEKILVLDVKQFLIRKCSSVEFNIQKKIKINEHDYVTTFKEYGEDFKIQLPEYTSDFTTPFLFEKPVIDEIFQMFDSEKKLNDFFYSRWKVSEFILYSMLCEKIKFDRSVLLVDDDYNFSLLWAPFQGEKKSSYVEDIDYAFKTEYVKLFGVHRFAWISMTDDEKRYLWQKLYDICLVENASDPFLFLSDDEKIIKQNYQMKLDEFKAGLWDNT